MKTTVLGVVTTVLLAWGPAWALHPDDEAHVWSPDELAAMNGLRLASLGELPPAPSNAYADDPRAAALGKEFFFDGRFSGNQQVSCATCHRVDMGFTDNLPLAHGMGFTSRRSMPLIGLGYQRWFFWDGRKDSLWSQALGPIESPVEHGFTRTLCFSVISEHYADRYEKVFGPLPKLSLSMRKDIARPSPDDPAALKAWVTMSAEKREAINRTYVNMGKAIGAFVRSIVPEPARFDAYADAALEGDMPSMRRLFSSEEAAGLRLFIGKAKCTNCHNGPLFTNGDFHTVGVPDGEDGPPDAGRAAGIPAVLSDEFNCLSPYSDAGPGDCAELRYMDTDTSQYEGAFKTPSLRGVADRPPYMHAGQLSTLNEVLRFYRNMARERGSAGEGHTSIEHADLTDDELTHLEAFLKTLSSPLRSPYLK